MPAAGPRGTASEREGIRGAKPLRRTLQTRRLGEQAAVHRDRLAGDEAGGVAGKKHDHVGHVFDEVERPDVNVYDMRLTAHEDGWIYGLFCVERKDPAAPPTVMRGKYSAFAAPTNALPAASWRSALRTSGLRRTATMEHILTAGDADFVALARPLIREPHDSNYLE